MSLFGFGDLKVLAIIGLIVLLGGRKQAMLWVQDIKKVLHDWKREDAEFEQSLKASDINKQASSNSGAIPVNNNPT